MTTEDIETKKPWANNAIDRFIIFIDILGFKDSLAREDINKVYDKLNKLSQSIDRIQKKMEYGNNETNASDSIKIYQFSDSIIVFSKDDSKNSLHSSILAAEAIFTTAIKESIPLKGAISFGKSIVNQSRQIFLGQPLIDAFLLQEDVKFYGIVAHNSVEKFIIDNADVSMKEDFENHFFETIAYLKSGNTVHRILNWFQILMFSKNYHDNKLEIEDENVRIKVDKEYLVNEITKFRQSTTGYPRNYIDNTVKILEEAIKYFN
jgi:hypothetical protein